MNAYSIKDECEISRQDLIENELEALYKVSRILGRSLDLEPTLTQVLHILDEEMDLKRGLVTISDPTRSEVRVSAVHGEGPLSISKGIKYRSGEGIIGRILASGSEIVLGRVANEPNFLHKLDIYDFELPFIGVPIKIADDETIGVLAAQPDSPCESYQAYLPELTRFLRMVANLIVQHIQLANKVENKRRDLLEERDELRREVRVKYGYDKMVVGRTEAMRQVYDQVKRVGKWGSTSLILGESGTGKELIASSIHYNSPRSNKPFVKLNCAALPENLLESELFGHERHRDHASLQHTTTQPEGILINPLFRFWDTHTL